MLARKLTVQDLHEQEAIRTGLRVIDDLEAEIAAQAADNAEYSEGITIEAAIPGEHFAEVSMTAYEDPDFLVCFSDLMGCRSVHDKAVRLSEYLSVYEGSTDIVDRAALEALPSLGLEAAKQLLRELQTIAPDRNWAECMSYMRETLAS